MMQCKNNKNKNKMKCNDGKKIHFIIFLGTGQILLLLIKYTRPYFPVYYSGRYYFCCGIRT